MQRGFVNAQDPPYGATVSRQRDSTGALQRAIDAAGAGGVVELPAGLYRITSPLVVGLRGVTLRGSGHAYHHDVPDGQLRHGAVIYVDAAMSEAINWTGTRGTIEGITIQSNSLATVGLRGEGDFLHVRHCGFIGATTTDLLVNSSGAWITDSWADSKHNGTGLHVGSESSDSKINNCVIVAPGSSARALHISAVNCQLVNCHFWSSVPGPAEMVLIDSGGGGASFVNCYWNITADGEIGVRTSASHTRLVGCRILGGISGSTAIRAEDGQNLNVTACSFVAGLVTGGVYSHVVNFTTGATAQRSVLMGNNAMVLTALWTGTRPGLLWNNAITVQTVGFFLDRNAGVASVQNGGVIAHGLLVAPRSIQLTPAAQVSRFIAAYNVTATQFQVRLADANNANITTPENVYWYAEI